MKKLMKINLNSFECINKIYSDRILIEFLSNVSGAKHSSSWGWLTSISVNRTGEEIDLTSIFVSLPQDGTEYFWSHSMCV